VDHRQLARFQVARLPLAAVQATRALMGLPVKFIAAAAGVQALLVVQVFVS
jgi:hypothetical protein